MAAAGLSSVGIQIRISTTFTYPAGFIVTSFSDDSDQISFEDITVGETAMTLGGLHIGWNKPTPIKCSLSIVPTAPEADWLANLLNANRVAGFKLIANDLITMNIVYPQGNIRTLTGGFILSGPPANTGTSAGRLKTNIYQFAFGDSTISGNTTGILPIPAIV